MMNEASNACCIPQDAPAILAVAEENAKKLDFANEHIESVLRKLRGSRPIPQTEACHAEPAFGALQRLTEAPKSRVPWLASQTDMLAEDWEIFA